MRRRVQLVKSWAMATRPRINKKAKTVQPTIWPVEVITKFMVTPVDGEEQSTCQRRFCGTLRKVVERMKLRRVCPWCSRSVVPNLGLGVGMGCDVGHG